LLAQIFLYNFFNKHLKEELVHFYLNLIFAGITKVMKSLPIFNPEPKIIQSRKNIMKSVPKTMVVLNTDHPLTWIENPLTWIETVVSQTR